MSLPSLGPGTRRPYDCPLPLDSGARLGHYEIVCAIGAGGMGVVYRAIDERLNRSVAIKVIAPEAVADPDRRQRFVREARAASALTHPNIVTIHDIDHSDGVDYLVMELVSGRTLAELIPETGLPVARALDWGEEIVSALAAAHAAGIIHRDIKPANVMVAESGGVKVLDFGLAKRLDRIVDEGASTIATTAATDTGTVLGTVAYMSPEQAQGQPIDGRTDVFSVGCVLYEMLAGRPAFGAGNAVTTLSTILTAEPVPVSQWRRDAPVELARLVHDCLIKDRERRPVAADVLQRLSALRRSMEARPPQWRALVHRPAVLIPIATIVVAAIALGVWRWRSTAGARWARNVALPEIQRLADRDDFDGVYRLAREAVVHLPDDPRLKQLWIDMTFLGRVETNPPGADVEIKGYTAEAADWIPIGRTPLTSVRLPFGALRVRVSKTGYVTREAAAGFFFTLPLDTPASAQQGMVRVNGAAPRVGTSVIPVKEFWIDTFEVTNRQYKEFVDKGGYRTPGYWKEPFVDAGRTLAWAEAMARFRDATGRPGPATWELGSYPEDQADLPVGGVSWYEAAAYAVFRGKHLPTAAHWRAAAGFYAPLENFPDSLLVSNFAGKGPAPVGSFKGLGPFGTYDLAGNVKEWCWNEFGGKRLILGGAWNETSYMFMDPDGQPPLERLPTYGFRLMKEIEPSGAQPLAPVTQTVRDISQEKPVDDAQFGILRSLYDYDARPLNATIHGQEETPAWRKETVSYDAGYGKERIPAYLFLPANASPPYQTVLYFPGGDAQLLRSSRDLRLRFVDFVIRSGRAVLFPVYKGTYERPVTLSGPNDVRDLAIARVKDMKRSLDYLGTRQDVDMQRLGFYGISLGAYNGILFTATEARVKASVLLGSGVIFRPPRPEIDTLHFAPRITAPTLMVNGRSDFAYPYEKSQLPLFRLLGPPPDKKEHATFEGGHIPIRVHDVIGRIVEWFDRHLGPVAN